VAEAYITRTELKVIADLLLFVNGQDRSEVKFGDIPIIDVNGEVVGHVVYSGGMTEYVFDPSDER